MKKVQKGQRGKAEKVVQWSLTVGKTDCVGEQKWRQSSERQRRQERLLTSGYEACRFSAGGG